MIFEGDEVVFSTGKREYANYAEIIGINPDNELFCGCDDNFGNKNLSPEECQELADHMIAQWQSFKEQHKAIGY